MIRSGKERQRFWPDGALSMKIFYAGCEYDHFDPKRGRSFEHENMYVPLAAYPGATVTYFPFERILEGGDLARGREKFNKDLIEAVQREKPDLLFVFPYSDELEPATLDALKQHTRTVAWFADDSWRFYNYSKFWATHYSWAITTYSWMPPLYRAAGQPNVIRSQWAADTARYKPALVERGESGPDVSFVGSWSRPRAEIIEALGRRGIRVAAYGGGWPGGRISHEDMLRIFATSRINLALNPAPGLWNKNSIGRLVARPSLTRIVPDFHFAANFEAWLHRDIPQVKARHFEIPACGGFMMTGGADDLDRYYEPGKEIAMYGTVNELVEKIRYYLAHEDERAAMARAAYERTIREHTYQRRFEEIFKMI